MSPELPHVPGISSRYLAGYMGSPNGFAHKYYPGTIQNTNLLLDSEIFGASIMLGRIGK